MYLMLNPLISTPCGVSKIMMSTELKISMIEKLEQLNLLLATHSPDKQVSIHFIENTIYIDKNIGGLISYLICLNYSSSEDQYIVRYYDKEKNQFGEEVKRIRYNEMGQEFIYYLYLLCIDHI